MVPRTGEGGYVAAVMLGLMKELCKPVPGVDYKTVPNCAWAHLTSRRSEVPDLVPTAPTQTWLTAWRH